MRKSCTHHQSKYHALAVSSLSPTPVGFLCMTCVIPDASALCIRPLVCQLERLLLEGLLLQVQVLLAGPRGDFPSSTVIYPHPGCELPSQCCLCPLHSVAPPSVDLMPGLFCDCPFLLCPLSGLFQRWQDSIFSSGRKSKSFSTSLHDPPFR